MSIQEVSSIKSVSDYVINNIDSESKQKAEKVKSLFTERFYNGSNSSASSIANEITRLESYLEQKVNEYDKTYAYIKLNNEELNILNQQLQREIYEATQQADADERKQKKAIEKAIDETNQMYMDGEIEKSEMPTVLSRKIAQYCTRDNNLALINTKLSSVQGKIAALTDKIAELIDQANRIDTESKLVQGTLVMMRNLMSKMDLGASNSATADNERPIYTPTKQALVDTLAKNIKGLTKDGEYDACSMNNPQLAELKKFLGMNGNGNINSYGVLADSSLNKMKEAGFTSKEALYAINWIFDKCHMSYKPGEQWSVPYGHGEGAPSVYKELIDQVKKLWGADALRGANEDPQGGGGSTGGTGTTPQDDPTPTIADNPTRTDPIGYAVGDTTYEFVVDRNNDHIFNSASEFLGAGANRGINELKALDTNGDGTIDKDEMESNEQLFVLVTDHQTGAHSFKSISEAGINSIDLTSLSSKNWTNINNNILRNTFTVNTVSGGNVEGYQTDDDNFFIKKSYNGVMNAEMAVTVDEEAINQADRIFNDIKTLSAEEYGDIAKKAAKSVKNANRDLDQTYSNMESELDEADNGLTTQTRPLTAEEKAAKEAEEAEKAEKAAKEAEEAEKAEKTEKAEKEKEEDEEK